TRCRQLVVELGLGAADDVEAVEPLTGGVASDIARVRVAGRNLCVKFALPKLKVAAHWQAPVHRNAADYAWLQVAHRVSPRNAVALLGHSSTQFGFAMAFLEGDGVYLWKDALLDEAPDRGEAAAVGEFLGRVHAASTAPDFDASPFHNRDDFHALRIEPYLGYTATQHPDVAPALHALADTLYHAEQVLVHGDVSPKNIFFRDGAPVLLDAECATLGDASFDPAFCLNHLVLKAVHLPDSRIPYLGSACALWGAYLAHVSWEDTHALERRVCRLLPALMLARVDGKSPVEYLDAAARETVRTLSRGLLLDPPTTVTALVKRVTEELIDP
ncbi:MAG: aminoglycoside phosphotransferase family protein, partial [Pseudomonadota bacterium]